MTEVSVSLNGSKPLIISTLSSNVARVPSSKALARAAMLEEARQLQLATTVERVSSVTFTTEAYVVGTRQFTINGTLYQKVQILVTDPTAFYTRTTPETTPPDDVVVLPASSQVVVPIGKPSTFEATRAEWMQKAPWLNLPMAESHHTFTGPFIEDCKMMSTSAPLPEMHSKQLISMSVLAYLPPTKPNDKGEAPRTPDGIGMSFRIHNTKQISGSNSPHIMRLFIENPQLLVMPVPSYEMVKKLDTELKNTGKDGKINMVGSMIVSLPSLCGNFEMEQNILEMDKGTLCRIGFLQEGDKSPFIHKTKENKLIQRASIVFNLMQWDGDVQWRDVVVMQLWSESLRLYGCTDTGPWGNGIGNAMVTQTPGIFPGLVNHTDSDAQTRAKSDDSIKSTMALNAQQPIMDVPGAIANIYGVPVSRHWAMTMAVPIKRNGAKDATPHTFFTFADPLSYPLNFYNKSDETMMLVLNEMHPADRIKHFDKKDEDWLYFAVIGNKIMFDSDKVVLKQLRELQSNKDYKGPLGEMLTYPDWMCTNPMKWKAATYGPTSSVETTILPTHPVLTNNKSTFASGASTYIFAISPSRYNAAVSQKVEKINIPKKLSAVPQLTIENGSATNSNGKRTHDDANADTSNGNADTTNNNQERSDNNNNNNNNDDDNNNNGNDDDNRFKFQRFDN